MVMTARRLVALSTAMLFALILGGGMSPASAQIPYSALAWNEPRYAAVVIDANSGEVLYAKNADSPRYPASITKIMTLYLTFEALQSGKLSLSDTIVISSHAASMAPTKLGLQPGDTITVDEAIRAIAVKSANDMAVALAEKLGGTENRFAALMTLRAQELGMTNSQFVNASGLPDSRQVSSARDIAILSRSVMRDFPQFYSYFGQRQFIYRGQAIANHNHLLDSMPGVDGLKTGYTNASGYNLAASAVQDDRRLIAVVMGGSSTAARDANVEDLLNTGFDVMRRKARGENITLAQNLFEPAPAAVLSPSIEQGDADQKTPNIYAAPDLTAPGAMRPIADPIVRADTVTRAADVQRCVNVKIVKYVRKHGRRIKVSDTERKCTGGARLTQASDVKDAKVCRKVKVGKGRHAKTILRCRDEATKVSDNDSDDSPKLTKAVLRGSASAKTHGDWQVQVGAFKSRADARTELSRVARRFDEQVGDAEANVGSAVGGFFRARFVGLSAAAAHEACSVLKARGQTCLASVIR